MLLTCDLDEERALPSQTLVISSFIYSTPYVSHHQEFLQETLFVVRDPLCKGRRYCIRCHLHSAAVIHFKPLGCHIRKQETSLSLIYWNLLFAPLFGLTLRAQLLGCTGVIRCLRIFVMLPRRCPGSQPTVLPRHLSHHHILLTLASLFFPFSFFHLSLLLVLDEKLETAHINSTTQTQSWLKQKRWSQSSAHRTGTPR